MTLQDLYLKVQQCENKTIAAIMAQDDDLLKALDTAHEKQICDAILIGDPEEIKKAADIAQVDTSKFEILSIKEPEAATDKAVDLIFDKKADFMIKGKIQTGVMLKQILRHEKDFTRGKLISHVAVIEIPGYDRLFFLSDSGLIIDPSVEEKVKIVDNAISFARKIGVAHPKVALLSALETVNTKIRSTVEAEQVKNIIKEHHPGIHIEGPISFDLSISEHSAEKKGYVSPVAGKADILIMPEMVAGNILAKSLIYCANAKIGGVITGGVKPIVLLSRSDTSENKLNSIVLGSIVLLEA